MLYKVHSLAIFFSKHLTSQAHVCISTTARHAAEQGYDVVVVEDAVGDRDIPGVDGRTLTRIALAELGDAFATIIKSDSINA